MLAGDSILGSFNIDTTERMTASAPRIGLHLSSAVSNEFIASVPGGCKIEMQTSPGLGDS